MVYRPDSVDGFVEGRSILSYLSKDTYVQWLAYGAMFPLEAKDFLVVTTLEPWDKKTNEGFVIASTSVDSMCEMGRCVRRNSLTGGGDRGGGTSSGGVSSGSESHTQKKAYRRTFLRLSGYVGVPNADGSTSLTFILDLPMEHRRISASWLLRYLAQYSLTELVGRIRHALSPFSLGGERVLQRIQRSATEVAEQDDTTTTLPGASPLLGGGGTRTADLSRMLASIQDREEAAARRRNNIERVPVLSSHRPDGINNVDYFNPQDEHQASATSGRSRLESDGYSIWRDVRSRANSLATTPMDRYQDGYELSLAENSPEGNSGGVLAGAVYEGARLPPLTPTARHRKSQSLSGIATTVTAGAASASTAEITPPPHPRSPRHNREKGLSTFQLLKRSLGRRNRKHNRHSAAVGLHLAHPDEDDSSDHRLSTPDCSPRGSERKSIQSHSHYPGPTPPSSPFVSLPAGVVGVGGKLLPRISRGEEVDLHAVQRELSRISPSRRHSRTEQRRRTLSQSEDAAAVAAALAAAGHHLPLARAVATAADSVPVAVHRSQSSGDAVKQSHAPVDDSSTAADAVSVPHSHSLNDLPALAARSTAVFVPLQEAWEKYSIYFDAQRAAAQLGIDWQLKLNKPNIHIYSSMVEGNSWCAIKAVTVMRTTPMALVKVLLDYSRMGEYDNMFKTSSVSHPYSLSLSQLMCYSLCVFSLRGLLLYLRSYIFINYTMLCILSFFTVVGTASRRQHSDTATVLQGGLAHCAARLCGVRFLAPECGRHGLHRITLGVGLPLRPGEALCARLPAAQWVSTGAVPGGQCSNCTAILCPRRCAGSRRVQGDLAQPH